MRNQIDQLKELENAQIDREMKVLLPGPTINITQQGYNQLREQIGRNLIGSSREGRIDRRMEVLLPGTVKHITQQGYNQLRRHVERNLK